MVTESLAAAAPARSDAEAFDLDGEGGDRDAAEYALRSGLRLGRYVLAFKIAAGGMAEVWTGRQQGHFGFSRYVAIKTIRPELAAMPGFRAMFLEEARLASRIHHANVVEILDLGEEGPLVYQVMALVEGDSLAGLIDRWQGKPDDSVAGAPLLKEKEKEHGLPANVALRVMADAARGLHSAHELTDDDGVPLFLVHRDVSPQNILVGIDGVAKIADFGIAKALGRVAEETEAGQLKGKFSYLSPEQAERKTPDRRSDVYACGIVLWEMLTGTRLFRGDDVIDTLDRVRRARVPDPSERAPSLARYKNVIAATMKALSRDPDDRFPTAAAFADALDAAMVADGCAATTQDVVRLVDDLAGKDVARRREHLRRGEVPDKHNQTGSSIAEENATMGGATRTIVDADAPVVASAQSSTLPMRLLPQKASTGGRKIAIAGAAAMSLVLVAVGTIAVVSTRKTVTTSSASSVTSSASASSDEAPATTTSSSSEPAVPAAVASSLSSPPVASSSRASTGVGPRRAPSGRPGSPRAPKYDKNPYGQ